MPGHSGASELPAGHTVPSRARCAGFCRADHAGQSARARAPSRHGAQDRHHPPATTSGNAGPRARYRPTGHDPGGQATRKITKRVPRRALYQPARRPGYCDCDDRADREGEASLEHRISPHAGQERTFGVEGDAGVSNWAGTSLDPGSQPPGGTLRRARCEYLVSSPHLAHTLTGGHGNGGSRKRGRT